MAQPSGGWLGGAFLLVNSYVGNPNLRSLTKLDDAARDFWNTFSALRLYPMIYYNQPRDVAMGRLEEFVKELTTVGTVKYAVFFFIGHGGDGDTLVMQNGRKVTTKEIDDILARLPRTMTTIIFIDACRGPGTQGGYSPECSNCIMGRSTLPHAIAWTGQTYGTY